jgi:hypothetical protein
MAKSVALACTAALPPGKIPQMRDTTWHGMACLQAPTPTPTPVTPTAANQSKDEQKYDRSYKSVYYQGNEPHTKVNTKLRQQPIADERADEADHQIADKPKPTTLHDSTRQPPSNNTDNYNHQQTLIKKVHDSLALVEFIAKSYKQWPRLSQLRE